MSRLGNTDECFVGIETVSFRKAFSTSQLTLSITHVCHLLSAKAQSYSLGFCSIQRLPYHVTSFHVNSDVNDVTCCNLLMKKAGLVCKPAPPSCCPFSLYASVFRGLCATDSRFMRQLMSHRIHKLRRKKSGQCKRATYTVSCPFACVPLCEVTGNSVTIFISQLPTLLASYQLYWLRHRRERSRGCGCSCRR